MSSHGLVSSALFLCVGVLYDRHKTRLVRYYGGSVSTMPNFPTIFFSSTLANMSLPGTSSFIGEFLILVGAFKRSSLVATLAALGMILGAAYSLWLYNRAVSGNLKADFLHQFSDPNGREVSIFIPFLVGGATVKLPSCKRYAVSWGIALKKSREFESSRVQLKLMKAGARKREVESQGLNPIQHGLQVQESDAESTRHWSSHSIW